MESVHIDGARRIARACREAGVKQLVHFSALGASEQSPSRFLRSKAMGELAVREEFPDAIIIRPAAVYGHGDRFVSRYMRAMIMPYGVPLTTAMARAKIRVRTRTGASASPHCRSLKMPSSIFSSCSHRCPTRMRSPSSLAM